MSNAAPVVVGRHRAVTTESVSPVRVLATTRKSTEVSTGRGRLRRVGNAVLSLVLTLCLLIFVLLALGPHVLGYRTSTMLTGSMEPGIMPGDVVVTAPRPAADIQVGDVISYQIPVEDHRVETHRVTEVIHEKDGRLAIRTQGDANDNVDPWVAVLEDDTVWEMQAVVPKLGTVIRAMRSPIVSHGLKWVALAGLILLGLTQIWSRTDETDDTKDNDDTDTGNTDENEVVPT
jgi:signal peptidase I